MSQQVEPAARGCAQPGSPCLPKWQCASRPSRSDWFTGAILNSAESMPWDHEKWCSGVC